MFVLLLSVLRVPFIETLDVRASVRAPHVHLQLSSTTIIHLLPPQRLRIRSDELFSPALLVFLAAQPVFMLLEGDVFCVFFV